MSHAPDASPVRAVLIVALRGSCSHVEVLHFQCMLLDGVASAFNIDADQHREARLN